MEDNKNTPTSNELNNANDKFFKGMMSLVPVVRAYSEQFLPKNILDKLDLDTLEFDNTSYITDELSEFFADMVWQCRYKEGNEYANISFLHEHKSYKPTHPHFQLLDYIRGAWRMQMGEKKKPSVIIPIVLYHGKTPWEVEPFDSYFGKIDPDFLRFLPCFDYILVNLQKYSDKTIKAFDSIFLQKSLLAFKHHVDKIYLKIHIVELLVEGYDEKKDDPIDRFIRMFGVYLSSISGLSSHEIVEEVNKSDNSLKSKAMSIFDEYELKGETRGEARGEARGITQEKHNTIIRSWKNGIDIPMISNITGVDVSEIRKVIAEHQAKI